MTKRLAAFCVALLGCLITSAKAQTYEMVEPAADGRIFQNNVSVSVSGDFLTPGASPNARKVEAKPKKPASKSGKGGESTSSNSGSGAQATRLTMNVKAALNFRSRRLASAGRDARSFRSLRRYSQANADINVNNERSKSMLPANLKSVVAEGKATGLLFYSPEVVMSRNNVDLLSAPADPLAIVAMLPKKEVKVGESWSPDSWSVSMLTSVEAVLNSKMSCTLAEVKGNIATVEFEGEIQGAIAGAETKISLSGKWKYDLGQKAITKIELQQTENRSVGTVSPGMNIKANVVVDRKVTDVNVGLSKKDVDAISLDPGRKAELLSFQPSKWDLRFFHGRNWHIFQEVPQVVVIRLIENGSLIAQCNAAKIRRVAAGAHTPEQQFQADIRKSLGKNLKSLAAADEVKVGKSIYIYRVIAEGQVGETPVQWRYYLCAAPDGRQVSFVFAVDPKQLSTLDDRDLAIVSSIQFLPEK